MRDNVFVGIVGTQLDRGTGAKRWSKWRPTVSAFQHDELLFRRAELIVERRWKRLGEQIAEDIRTTSPETDVRITLVEFKDAWDFEEVWEVLYGFSRELRIDPEREDCMVHITTGTHVAQICLFLLAESRHLPGRLLQTSPRGGKTDSRDPSWTAIDLDLSRYDRIAARFREEQRAGVSFLKSGIDTRNVVFNQLIDRVEQVAIATTAPLLLMGPTGAGKTRLARRIYELKRSRRQVTGNYVEVNCATLRGDLAMSTLFGHTRGAFSGAQSERAGLLRTAHGGVLFLDEIGELGADEQAMLLRALESRTFLPVGSDEEASSDFQLLAGTKRDLYEAVADGDFREDLLARINLWTVKLPGLRERPEDIEPNLDYELEEYARKNGRRISMNKEARADFLAFARGSNAAWRGNFRDLNAAVLRMGTLAPGGRIDVRVVDEELGRLRDAWRRPDRRTGRDDLLQAALGDRVAELDRFDRVQLAEVLEVCGRSRTLAEAGRELFAVSRLRRSTRNDADRVRKYLAKWGLSKEDVLR